MSHWLKHLYLWLYGIQHVMMDRNTDALPTIWMQEQLEDYTDKQDVILSLTTLGPAYLAIARLKHNQTKILEYVEGFV